MIARSAGIEVDNIGLSVPCFFRSCAAGNVSSIESDPTIPRISGASLVLVLCSTRYLVRTRACRTRWMLLVCGCSLVGVLAYFSAHTRKHKSSPVTHNLSRWSRHISTVFFRNSVDLVAGRTDLVADCAKRSDMPEIYERVIAIPSFYFESCQITPAWRQSTKREKTAS